MEPKIEIYKANLNFFFNKLAKLFSCFFPGMVILELFFKKGFFSHPPIDTFSFFLFLFWCGTLSIPYNILQPWYIDKFEENLSKLFFRKNKVSEIKMDKEKQEYWDNAMEEFVLGFILIKLILTYIILKIMLIIFPFIIKIPIIFQFFVTLILVIIISYPVACIYSKIFLCLAKKIKKPTMKAKFIKSARNFYSLKNTKKST